jgi:hypothetical protein
MSLLLTFLIALNLPLSSRQPQRERGITDDEVKEVIQAVQDEIYDYGYEKDFYQIGKNVGTPSKYKSKLPIYVNPKVRDGEGEAIYKLMPFGEVLRLFHIRADGMVVLDGDPQVGFPPTQPNVKTLCLDDDKVCQMKREWLHLAYEVEASPEIITIEEASRRQKLRTGFSEWQHLHSK